ncbi:hypothetical protein [Streptomyces sp. NPDC020681]|uniref:hypothetical protein n=1 Tax=Streptomyces sp. NPDC020681 TaxID=3365083 RepID=UPI00379A5D08
MNDPRIPHDHEYGPEPAAHKPPETGREHAVDGDDAYSATALGSHWFERPEPQAAPEGATLLQDPQWSDVAPDRVEGEVLRFGPGVTAVVRDRSRSPHNTTAAVWHGTLAGQSESAEPSEKQRGGLRRYALAAGVLVCVLAFLAWQRYGPALSVEGVAVRTPSQGPGCDQTADIVGVVDTNGRPGTVSYRWTRSDGTTSGLLQEKLTRGQKQAHLHLLWTFRGRGEYRASAVLQITSPTRHTATAHLTYRCG